MKFSELPYIRPDLDQLRAQCDALCARFENAASAEEQAPPSDPSSDSGQE